MSLSTEEKQLYAVFIHNVYNGAVHADADDITPEVADIRLPTSATSLQPPLPNVQKNGLA